MADHIRTISILLILALCVPAFAGSDPATEAVLTSKGLTRVGLTYLLPDDLHLRDKLRATRQAKSQVDFALAKRNDLQKEIRAAQDAIENGAAQDHDINQRMQNAHSSGDTIRYNNLVDQSHVIESQMRQTQRYVDDRQAELSKLAIPSDKYINALSDLMQSLEATAQEYQRLATDQDVKDALARLNAQPTPKYKLGPSLEFTTNFPLIRAEHELVSTAAVRFNNATGTPLVDVVLNGQVRKSMFLDSGASYVSLPWKVADELGMSPGPDDRTVELSIANGKTAKATLMSLKTVQLGQFIVHDVECVVAPKSQKDSPMLLGGSFLRNFVYKMDLAGGQVFLTQINGASASGTGTPTATTPGSGAGPAPDPETVAKAITVLETKPLDPAANFVVGRYCCFTKGDWAEGLPMLAKGSDPAVRGLAVAELKDPKDGGGQMSLADGWWAYADTMIAPEKTAIQSHALDDYRKALPALTGLAKLKAETRLAGPTLQPPTALNGGPTSGESPRAIIPTPSVADGFVDVMSQMRGEANEVDGIVSFVHGTVHLTEKYQPPVEFRVVAQGGSNDIRFGYGRTVAIFNWADDPTLLRFDYPPPGVSAKKGAGLIEPGKWTTFDLIYEPHAMTIRVDGQERFHADAEIKDIDQPFRIMRSARDSLLQIKSILVRKPREIGTTTNNKPEELPVPAGRQALTNSIGMKLIRIDPGTFMMGSPASELGRVSGESPQHQVTLTRGFYMGQTLITQEAYRRVMGTNPSVRVGPAKDDIDVSDFPVENVSCDEAIEFCQTLSAMPAEKQVGHVYRLPTEAEWEYACRAGTKTAFYFGDEPSPKDANIGSVMSGPTRVGSYPPNPWGMYDMCGNVWEWCADDNRHYDAMPAVDPQGQGPNHVRRGGQYDSEAKKGRSAGYREGSKSDARSPRWGFRVVMDIDPHPDVQGEKPAPAAPKNPETKGLFGSP